MKVAITGHTRGIGKAIAEYFTGRGDDVVGFSRSNGFILPKDWSKIVHQANQCDIFVNNARALGGADLAQSRILCQLCNDWRGMEKKIINIGSISGRNPISQQPIYTAQKAALKTMATIFQSRQLLPRIFHLDFGKIATERTKNQAGLMMTPADIVKVIDFYLSFPHDILDLTFRHKEALSVVT